MAGEERSSGRQGRLMGTCLLLAPLAMFFADLALAAAGADAFWVWSVGLWISLYLFVGALLGIIQVLTPRAEMFGLVFGSTAIFGALMGATMQGLFRARFVLEGNEPALAELAASSLIPLTTVMPGILFPLSLLILSIGLGRVRALPWSLAAALGLGALLFPVGRFIIGNIWINVASDALMIVALGSLGIRLCRSPVVAEPASLGTATLAPTSA